MVVKGEENVLIKKVIKRTLYTYITLYNTLVTRLRYATAGW